ncbi:hypothetical protein D3C85_1868610 [compost metagenome]
MKPSDGWDKGKSKMGRPKSHIWIAILGTIFILASGFFLMWLSIEHFIESISTQISD